MPTTVTSIGSGTRTVVRVADVQVAVVGGAAVDHDLAGRCRGAGRRPARRGCARSRASWRRTSVDRRRRSARRRRRRSGRRPSTTGSACVDLGEPASSDDDGFVDRRRALDSRASRSRPRCAPAHRCRSCPRRTASGCRPACRRRARAWRRGRRRRSRPRCCRRAGGACAPTARRTRACRMSVPELLHAVEQAGRGGCDDVIDDAGRRRGRSPRRRERRRPRRGSPSRSSARTRARRGS